MLHSCYIHKKETSKNVLPRGRTSKSGVTLIEIIVSMTIFGLISAGVFSSALQARFLAEKNVRESIATVVAMGFMEQVLASDFTIVETHMNNRSLKFGFVSQDGQPLNNEKSLLAMGTTDWGKPITIPLIDKVDENGDSVQTNAMDLWLIPMVAPSTDNPENSIDIIMTFRWIEDKFRGASTFRERTITTTRSRVPTP